MPSFTQTQKNDLDIGFFAAFGRKPERYFSAPGRTEIGGNHTDHQQGRVLAAAVNLDTRAAVASNGSSTIRVQSEGYPLCAIDLADLAIQQAETGTTAALVRGVAARFMELGCSVGGFDAYVTSSVLPGSGLSSSAAFEVLMGTIINVLFFDNRASAPDIAAIGQYAENVYFGKPCGLMDQTASAVGGLVSIDFANPGAPKIRPVSFDFSSCGHALCIIDTGASHADLTDEYAAIPAEMRAVAAYFGKEVLSQVPEADLWAAIPALRRTCSDRAVLRSIHYYRENRRAAAQADALAHGDFHTFLSLVRESGQSSWTLLQNVTAPGSREQSVALALALCEQILQGRGACRIHGGGFAGTVQAFVPLDLLDTFKMKIEAVLGDNACHVLSIRSAGGIEMKETV